VADRNSQDEWVKDLYKRLDGEAAAALKAAREEAAARGKEPFSAEVLAQYYTPYYLEGAEQAEIVRDLARQEQLYYVTYADVMTLEEYAKRLTEAHRYDW
jgi:hypothetical protein